MGALTIVPLRSGDDASSDGLRLTLKNMARVKVIRRRPSVAAAVPAVLPTRVAPPARTRPIDVIAIGASTGGPQTLGQVLTRLPAAFPIPVLVVQHIDPGFTHSLVEWLRPLCALPIDLAAAGHTVGATPGIYFAPPDRHLVVTGQVFGLLSSPPVSGHRPAANVLFESVAATYGAGAAGVVLTGMGEDGAAGLKRIADAGGVTVAQDEDSSIVYGMPRAAVQLGAAQHVLPPAEIAQLLLTLSRRM
jgi:two-component system chemotaxis response regulator CheB